MKVRSRLPNKMPRGLAVCPSSVHTDARRRALGWLHQEHGIPVEELSLSKLFPSAERAGVAVAFDYMQWLSARGISPSTEGAQSGAQCVARLHTLIATSAPSGRSTSVPLFTKSLGCMP